MQPSVQDKTLIAPWENVHVHLYKPTTSRIKAIVNSNKPPSTTTALTTLFQIPVVFPSKPHGKAVGRG